MAHKAPTTADLERRRLVRAYAARVAGAAPQPGTARPPAPEPAPVTPTAPAPVEADVENIDVADVLSRQVNPRSNGKPDTMYGKRGWTLDVADTIERFTDSRHEPASYLFGSTNGRSGLVRFAGMDAEAVTELAQKMPREAFADRQNNAPTLGTLIAAVNANPGRVELAGYVAGPARDDERVTVDGVYIYDDELAKSNDPGVILRAAKDVYGLRDAHRRPDELSVVDVPWRPGEKAIYLWWD